MNSTILITGATGVIGRTLVDELAGRDVTCLVHRSRNLPSQVATVAGDVRAPRLGLSPRQHRELASRTTHVIHCAAQTDFGERPAEIHATNLEATGHVLDFAAAAGARLLHVSTAFVGRREAAATGLATLGAHNGASAGIVAYVESKAACERLVERSGVRFTIARPSVVVGDSRTGAISRPQGLHMMMSMLVAGELPVFPVAADAHVDFLAQDVLAPALVRLLDRAGDGRAYWLTAGSHALSIQRFIDLGVACAAGLGQPIDAPRIVAPDIVERIIRPVLLEHLDPRSRRRFELLLALLALFQPRDPFPSDMGELRARGAGLRVEQAYRSGLGFVAAQQAARRPEAAVA